MWLLHLSPGGKTSAWVGIVWGSQERSLRKELGTECSAVQNTLKRYGNQDLYSFWKFLNVYPTNKMYFI